MASLCSSTLIYCLNNLSHYQYCRLTSAWISLLHYFPSAHENSADVRYGLCATNRSYSGGPWVHVIRMIFQLRHKLIFPFTVASHNSLLSAAFHAWLLNRISWLCRSLPAATNEVENWELISYWAEKTPSLLKAYWVRLQYTWQLHPSAVIFHAGCFPIRNKEMAAQTLPSVGFVVQQGNAGLCGEKS